MSKTAQRKKQAYQDGYKSGLTGAVCRVNKKWLYRKDWLNGVCDGRKERLRREEERKQTPEYLFGLNHPQAIERANFAAQQHVSDITWLK